MRIVMVLVMLLGMSLACNLVESDNPTSVPNQGSPTLPTPSIPPTSADGMQTYQDSVHGYTLSYPQGWHTIGGGEAVLTLMSYDPNAVQGREAGVPADETKLDIYVTPHQASTTLTSLEAQYTQEVTVLDRQEVTVNGYAGIRLHVRHNTFQNEAYILIVILNDLDVVATGFGDLQEFEQVALTLNK